MRERKGRVGVGKGKRRERGGGKEGGKVEGGEGEEPALRIKKSFPRSCLFSRL